MKCLDAWQGEHADIRVMLDVLGAAAARLRDGRHVDPSVLREALDFFERFVGASHEVKEERSLFPRLAAGAPDATVPAFVAQHRETSRARQQLQSEVERLQAGTPGAADRVATAAGAYATALREHLQLEETFVLRQAPLALTAADDEAVSAEFEEIQRAGIGPTGREWFFQLVADYRDILATWGRWPDVPGRE